MSEELIAESRRTDTEYLWDMSWDERGYSCSTSSPFGIKMPLWICIQDARDSVEHLMNEEDYDYLYSETPEIKITRYIDGKFDDWVEIGDWEEAVNWADDKYVSDEWEAYIQSTKDLTARLRAEAGLTP
jgi:hypothetical protein